MSTENPTPSTNDFIDFAELFARLRRGLPSIIGLTCLGLAIGITAGIWSSYRMAAVSTLRVTFGFPGFERGVYPNSSKFQPDDLRAPDVINEALKLLGSETASPSLSSRLREAIVVSGIVSPLTVKERDRLRATGQTVPPLIPDEYEVSLTLPRDIIPDMRQRERLLGAIISCYREKFSRSYVQLPPQFGNTFLSLVNADFVEYELVLKKDLESLTEYLEQQIIRARQFRSPTNNLSFLDLRNQAQLFAQIRMNDVLGLIYINGLSKDRSYALTKMEYYLHALEEQEHRLLEEESVITGLLTKTQERAQNYVLTGKTQGAQTGQPLVDQAFLDTLLANDSYNFLIRKALDAGLAVKRIKSEKAQLFDRRQRMETFIKTQANAGSDLLASTQQALTALEVSYKELLDKVSVCLADYARQEYSDAVRVTMQPNTASLVRQTQIAGLVGSIAGLALGLGLSLLGLGNFVRNKGGA